jgi:simple sugar transport system ATP-binding protein
VKGENTAKQKVHDLSLTVNEGEIVCIAGVDGNGQSELVSAITGLLPSDGGHIVLKGEDVTHRNIRYRNTHGLSHIPEDRHKHGLVLDYTLAENLVLQEYFDKRFQTRGFLKSGKINEYAEKLIKDFDIRSGSGASTKARSMSGGNQQKAIAAREISRSPDLLLAVQPTRGLDVGAIEYMHSQIVKARDDGKAVLVVSFDLNEVMNLADRILVMFEGEIVANVKPGEVTENELGLYMAGAKRGAAN